MSLTLPSLPAVKDTASDTASSETADTASSETALLPVPRPAADPVTDRLPRITARPVFVDATGRRLRRLRRIGALVGLACVGYLVVLAAAVGGGVVDPVTSGLPLSDAVAPLAADPATTTSPATTRSTATTTRATAVRSTAAVPAAAVPTTSAPVPTTAAPTSAPATTTSAPTSTSAPATDDTGTETTQAPETSAADSGDDTEVIADGGTDGAASGSDAS